MLLIIHEIFRSIEGETCWSGFPSVFVRLAGCNLHCSSCDTPDSRKNGKEMDMDTIIHQVRELGPVHHITVTGGEPLHQEDTPILMRKLLYEKYHVQLETNGSLPLSPVPSGVRKIVDVKTPSSGEAGSFLQENLEYIDENDELKFLICNRDDFEFSKNFMIKNLSETGAVVNFSPVYKKMKYRELSEWILEENLNVRLNLQLHKIINVR
jgi:7-carboxy-7-deazaguanine synthase